jgi:hypothetical protein
MIKPGEEIHLGACQRFRVLDVVPFEEEDESSDCYRSRRRSAGRRAMRSCRSRAW